MIYSSILDVGIKGYGSYLPGKVLTNEDLEKMLDTSDEWITVRSGIKERRICSPEETNSDMCFYSAQKALATAGLAPSDIDIIIVGTISGDYIFPATACLLQSKLGATNAMAFDISAACSGFTYSFLVGAMLAHVNKKSNVLVVGSELLSRLVDYQDRTTCVLFGDGAGAIVLSSSATNGRILYASAYTDGSNPQLLWLPAGLTKYPASYETVSKRMHYLKMQGKELFKLAVRHMGEIMEEMFSKTGLTVNDIDLIIPHQMNVRIMQALCEHFSFPIEKFFINIQKYGNTGAASIPIALDEAIRTNRVKKGDKIVLVSFGGGLTWSIILLEW